MTYVPDNPIIRNCERTGWPDGQEPEYPHCPVCHEPECAEVYQNIVTTDVVGCEACVTRHDAYNVEAFVHVESETPICPVCKGSCEYAYTDRDGEILGCDECLMPRNAWNRPECFNTD